MGILSEILARASATTLKNRLSATRRVVVSGIIFQIKRINVMDHLEGTQVIHEFFSTYRTKEQKETGLREVKSKEKVIKYLRDMVMAGVVTPKLVRKQDDDPEAIPVDELLDDWPLVEKLIEAILLFTYGKKK